MTPEQERTYRVYEAADNAWRMEVQRVLKAENDAYYTQAARGEPGSVLRTLHDMRAVCQRNWFNECDKQRSAL